MITSLLISSICVRILGPAIFMEKYGADETSSNSQTIPALSNSDYFRPDPSGNESAKENIPELPPPPSERLPMYPSAAIPLSDPDGQGSIIGITNDQLPPLPERSSSNESAPSPLGRDFPLMCRQDSIRIGELDDSPNILDYINKRNSAGHSCACKVPFPLFLPYAPRQYLQYNLN